MHLLALFIAAVFSSQFSKLSNSATFSVLPATAATNAKVKIQVTETAAPATWAIPVKLFFQAADTPIPAVDAEGWYTTALDSTSNGDDTYTTEDPVDFSAIDGLAKDDKIYVFAQAKITNVQTVLQVPAEITATGPWGMTTAAVHEDAFVIKNIAITKPDPGWTFGSADDKVKVYIHHEDVDPASDDPAPTWIAMAESGVYAENKYSIASIDTSSHVFDEDDLIYVYVQYNTDDGYVWAEGFQTITVAEAVPLFSISAPSTKSVSFSAATITPLTIKQEEVAGDLWDKADVKLALTFDPDVVPTAGDVAINSNATATRELTVDAYTFDPTFRRVPGDKIYVYVSLKLDAETWHVLRKRAEIDVTGTLAPTFDVTPTKIILAGTTTIDVVVTQTDVTRTNAAAWANGVSFFFTKNLRKVAVDGDAWIEATKDGASYKKTGYAISALELGDGDNVYVWVKHGIPTANAGTVLPLPAVIPVQAAADPIFTVTPTTFALPSVMDNIVVKQFDQVTEPWPAEITVYLTLDNTKAPADIPLKRTLTRTGEAPNWVYTIERFNFRELTGIVAGNVYVHVSYQAGDPATTVVVGEKKTIAVTGALPAIPFTVEAPEAILEAEIEDPVAFEILPGTGQNWASETVKLSITLTTVPPTGSSPAFTATITKQEEGDNWEGSIDLSTLVVPEGQTKVYAHVKVGDAAYLPDFAEITYTPGAAPDPTVFVLDPATVEWAAVLKLAKTAIKPTPEAPEDWPKEDDVTTMKFEILNPANTSIPAVTGTVAIEEAEGETPTKWFIPAETAITALVATEPTANVPLTVKISINNGVDWITKAAAIAVTPKEPEKPEAAMGVSPLLSLLAALVFLFVKLF